MHKGECNDKIWEIDLRKIIFDKAKRMPYNTHALSKGGCLFFFAVLIIVVEKSPSPVEGARLEIV